MTPSTNNANQTLGQAVGLRMRPDLVLIAQPQSVGRRWLVKDPTALTYHQLTEEEVSVLRRLDGRTTLEEIKHNFDRTFFPRRVEPEQLRELVQAMCQKGLVLVEAPGQGERLLQQHRQQQTRRRIETWSNPLAIRFRGVDPEPVLRWLYPKLAWVFSPIWLLITALLLIAAAVTILTHTETLAYKLPQLQEFFAAQNLLLLALTLSGVKILHELGHALACKHFGGECHEIGVMVLVFSPCLYCDVSDSWMIPSKWKRMAVAAAGIFVELWLASICTLLWAFSQPGVIQALCLNVMVVCSVGTLLFNGNPLLRYDAYFVLSDLLELPNLWQRSRAVVSRAWQRFVFGIRLPRDPTLSSRRRAVLASYGLASIAYRWFILIAILFFLWEFFRAYQLEIFAQIITIMVIVTTVLIPLFRWMRGWILLLKGRRIKLARLLVVCGSLIAVVAAAFLVPLPRSIPASFVIQAADAQQVYVTVPGTLTDAVDAGERLRAGQVIARLANTPLAREIARLEGDLQVKQTQLQNRIAQRSLDEGTGADIRAIEQSLADVRKQLDQRRRDQRRLTVTAPTAGVVLNPLIARTYTAQQNELSAWLGTPLDQKNVGCFLETGTLLCQIGRPDRCEALLQIRQDDLEFVRPGQQVRLALRQLPGQVITGTVEELSRIDANRDSNTFVSPSLRNESSSTSGSEPERVTSYQARVRLDVRDRDLIVGAGGRARISVAPQPIGPRIWRWLQQTFTFQL